MSSENEESNVEGFVPSLLSLQELAINTIVKNIGGYRDLITKKIAPPMRKILFDQAMERKKEIGEDQVWAALPYLDQHKTTERFSTKDFASIFRLESKSGGFSEASVSMEEFLRYLVEFVPNLKELEIEDPRTESRRMLYKKIRLQPLATDLLLKMQNLTEVSIIDVYITFTEFVRVCRESRNLQSIKANNILLDVEPIHSLKILETLHSKFNDKLYDEWKFPRKICICLWKANNVKPCRVAMVTLFNDFFDLIPTGLTHLRICAWKAIDFQNNRHRMLRNLRRVGGSLKYLLLQDLKPELKITFKHVFDHCHDLEILEIRDSCVCLDDPIASFGQLKKFYWINLIVGEDLRYSSLKLDRIFSAPHLQEITIRTNLIVDLGDIGSLLNRIRNRKILTKLTTMRIVYGVDHDYPRSKEEEFHELARELRSLGCSTDVSIIRQIGRTNPLSVNRLKGYGWLAVRADQFGSI